MSKRMYCCEPKICCDCDKCGLNPDNPTVTATLLQAAIFTDCPLSYTATYSLHIGSNGAATDAGQLCNAPHFAQGFFWEKTYSQTTPFTIDATSITVDWSGAGYTEYPWQSGGGGDSTFWLKRVDTVTAYQCSNPSNQVDIDLWLATRSTDGIADEVIGYGDTLVDATDYPALTISHDGEGSPTSLTCYVYTDSIRFVFVGGTYNGIDCTIPAENRSAKVAQCINAIGRGLSATCDDDDLVLGKLNPLVLTSKDLTTGSLAVEVNLQGSKAWTVDTVVWGDNGAIQDSVNAFDPSDPDSTVDLPDGTSANAFSVGATFRSGWIDTNKCYEQEIGKTTYCPNNQTYTLLDPTSPANPCSNVEGESNCYKDGGGCSIV